MHAVDDYSSNYCFETGRASPKSHILQSDPSTHDYTLQPAALNNRLRDERLPTTVSTFFDVFKVTINVL